MKKVILLFAIVVGLHFAGIYFGIYDRQIENGNVWYDNFLHLLAGVGWGLLWIWLLMKRGVVSSFVSILAFVVVTAVAWEAVEFLIMKFSSSYAVNLKMYSPTLQEAAFDILSNLVGGGLLVIYNYLFTHSQTVKETSVLSKSLTE